MANWNIHAATKGHGKGVAARGFREGTSPYDRLANSLERIRVKVGVCSSEQEVNERLNFWYADLELRTKQIEQVALGIP